LKQRDIASGSNLGGSGFQLNPGNLWNKTFIVIYLSISRFTLE